MPKFDKSKRYQDKNGRKFGGGVWLDDSGKPIMPGQGVYDENSKTVRQYNSDGTVTTFTRQNWVKKQQRDHEMRVLQNDRKYAAPYLPEKAMTIHTNVDGKAGRINLSENQLDSIAVNAKRAGLPFQTALGIGYKESTLGQHRERKAGTSLTPWLKTISNPFDKSDSLAQQAREVSYTGVQSPTLVISNWKQKLESPYAEYIYDSKLNLRDSKQSKEGPRTEQYYDDNFLSSLYWGNRYALKEENPLEHGFREYKRRPDRWNPGDPGYEEDVQAKGRQLMQSPEIQEYVKRNNVKSEGGSLQPKTAWDALSLQEMADMMKVAVRNGITDLKTIREKYNEFAEGGNIYDGTTEKSQKMDRRGYVPSDAIRKRIEGYEGKAMTGAIDPLSGRYARNNSFESEARGFYNALPESIRERVLGNPELADNLYSYSYNVGAGNFRRRVVPALERYYAGTGSADDVASSMWASGDSKLRGLQKRRAEERNGVLGALQGGQGTGISQAAVSEQPAFMPYDLGELFPAMPASDAVQMPSDAELRRQQRDAGRQERRNRLQSMMDIMDMVYGRSPDNPLVGTGLLGPLGAAMYGGGGHLFDGRSEPTQQMNIMAYHPDEDYWVGPATRLSEVTVTGKAPSWFGKKGLYPTRTYGSKKWVSPKGAGNMTVMPGDPEMVFFAPIAAGAGIAASPAIASTQGSAVSGINTAGDAIAATAAGQRLTSGLNFAANAVGRSKAWPWIDAGLTSVFGAHGVDKIRKGDIHNVGDVVETGLDVLPLTQLARPAVNTIGRVGSAVESIYEKGMAGARTAVENYRYPLGRPQVPEGYLTVKPQVRTEAGRSYNNLNDGVFKEGSPVKEDFIKIGTSLAKAKEYKSSEGYRALAKRAGEESEIIGTGFFPEEAFTTSDKDWPLITFSKRPKGNAGGYNELTNTVDLDLEQSAGLEVPFHEGLHWQGVGSPNIKIGPKYEAYQKALYSNQPSKEVSKLLTEFRKSPEYKRLEYRNNAIMYLRNKVDKALADDYPVHGYLKAPEELQAIGTETGRALGIEPFSPYPGYEKAKMFVEPARKYNNNMEHVKAENPEEVETFWQIITGNYIPSVIGGGLLLDSNIGE